MAIRRHSPSRPTRLTLDSSHPFTRRQALRAGVKPRELAGPHFRRVFHGLYVAAGARLNAEQLARAAMVVFPNAFASHGTAAQIWGGITPYDDRTHISVLPGETRSRRRGLTAHLATDDVDVVPFNRIRVSGPERCFCEMATDGIDLVALVVLGDSLVKAKATTPEKLLTMAESWPHRRAAVAVRAATLIRDDVDSAMESRLRMLIILAGLPEPEVNVILRHPNGDWNHRFELCYRDLKLLIEYDGDYHLDAEQRAKDVLRREHLEHLGWRFVVINRQHLFRDPGQILTRIRQARIDCGAPESTCRVRPNWRNYNFRG